ncbi:MAG TPA: MBL fold metallo-hydrolase [Bacteroidales bacterium]|nr:MBL fold metallo-hydrolase [Bacteroidales bacterium]HOH22534.1 MBL fold metallo-hydrolase [Bacteroidales bacterium]HPB57884.1 MBL fold metallo-hydrolase [Bacteroidales bacterium]HPZ02962.1 MBL fold metallo-hydrolase [Bacteroidales bacterium]HQB75366.1 MBL fold metallo-hydrolase [Bacteroidales bacterium]
MKFKIHRGTKEIGGSCVEVWTENTRILLDFGMPLVEKDGKEFDFNKYKNLTSKELVSKGILPNIEGLYEGSKELIDGVIISHSHQDHYGLANFINTNIQFYLGEATHTIIELNNLFTQQNIHLKNTNYFEKTKQFTIGDISITPYWADHSAFDAYSFLVEANGKSLFYSGDFRSHGRKSGAFRWFTHNAPQDVDYLLLEGTTVSREDEEFQTEEEIESELTKLFKQKGKINLIYTSGQNIDRITSIYKACLQTGKTFVVDVYVAKVLIELSRFGKIPFPSKKFENLKVIFPYYTSNRLTRDGNEKVLFQFKHYKIKKEEIANQAENIVMIVRPSMQKELEHIEGIDGGNLIYSMWEGYLKKSYTMNFVDYLTNREFALYQIHTSGHADTKTLKKLVEAIKPKNIVPIHTFEGVKYKDIFTEPIVELEDGEIREV